MSIPDYPLILLVRDNMRAIIRPLWIKRKVRGSDEHFARRDIPNLHFPFSRHAHDEPPAIGCPGYLVHIIIGNSEHNLAGERIPDRHHPGVRSASKITIVRRPP